MKGDFSKVTFKAPKHFHDVLMQQGRVLLDQEWNEQAAIEAYRTQRSIGDIIGPHGGSVDTAGFQIQRTTVMGGSPPAPLQTVKISKGTYYVDGMLVENEADVVFGQQPDFGASALPSSVGTYLFYLDVWLRHITALEDASIREIALGPNGPDTTTRTKTIWQVKAASVAAGFPCASGIPSSVTAAPTGTLMARSEKSSASDDPCGLTTTGGYRRLENQLYRIEIHAAASDRAHATFKWSRDNGSVIVKCLRQDSVNKNNLIASSSGRDELLGFKSGDWIELINEDNDQLETPGVLVQLLKVNEDVFTIDPATIKDPNNPAATSVSIDLAKNPRMRRWDSAGDQALNSGVDWISLEDGMEVSFVEGSFRTGSYWLIPARTDIADIEWPFTSAQLPEGIEHHYAPLAIADLSIAADQSVSWTITSDCRNLFPPLTKLVGLYYAGGDGQQAAPGAALPDTLKIGVANGGVAVAGARVKFEVLSGAGNLNPASGIITTDVEGIAACNWTLGSNPSDPLMQVKATLLDDAGNVAPGHSYVMFNAGYIVPAASAKKKCSFTVGEGGDFDTLEEVLNKFEQQRELCICLLPGVHVTGDIDFVGKHMAVLKISGCNATIRMKEKRISLFAQKIVLHGIDFDTVPENQTARIFLSSTELSVEQCRFTSQESEFYRRDCFIQIIPILENVLQTCLLHFKENTIRLGKTGNGIALGLSPGVNGWMENNTVQGATVLCYRDGNNNIGWNDGERVKITSLQASGALLTAGQLRICGNTLSNILSNAEGILANRLTYNSLFVCENVFERVVSTSSDGTGNSFVAAAISFINNQFMFGDQKNSVPLVGQRGIVMGNIALNDNTAIRLILSASVGRPAPDLNLAVII